MKKKVLFLSALIFAIVLTVLFAMQTSAATSGYYTYTVSNQQATITDVDTSISGYITIPSTLGGYPVKNIDSNAFNGCYNLTCVTIPNSVTSIGDYAFYNCENLVSVYFSSTVNTIGDYAFYNCESLVGVHIPAAVNTIGDRAFYSCGSLTSFTVDANNASYSNDEHGVLFNKSKTKLIQYPGGKTATQYDIPESVTTIDNYAFFSCNALTSIKIPEGVTSIGDYVLQACNKLTKAIIYSENVSFGEGVFADVKSHFSIYAYDGSTAEAYAEDNDIPFVTMEKYEIDNDGNFVGAIRVGTANVDGVLDEAYQYSFSLKNLGIAENAYGTAWPGTCTADVYFLYDNANLYICAEVEDDDVFTKGPAYCMGDNPYLNDNIEFRISLDGTTETIKVAVDAYGFACYGLAANYDRMDYSTIEYATTLTATSYVVEVAIPCTNANLNMIEAGKLGFTYQLNDINAAGKHYNHTTSFNGEKIKQPVFVALSSEQALEVPVTNVSLNKASTTLEVGATETLTATVSPSNATNKAVTWVSSNPSVATVTNGTVTALEEGTTTIIATTVDGSKTATCIVTVNAVNEDVPTLKIDDITVRPGESFYVDIVAENCDAIKAITVNDIEYSQSLTLTNAEWLLTGSTLSSIDINGDSLIAFQSAVDANKAIMRLYFTADGDATDEDAYIRYKAMGTDATNKNFDFIENDGTVTIRNFIVGDCDSDEVITVDDAIYLAFYTFYQDRYPIPSGMNVDFDKDGEVTVDDAIYLAFYTFYQDRYPLN